VSGIYVGYGEYTFQFKQMVSFHVQ